MRAGPWCYTTDAYVWDYCDIPKCGDPPRDPGVNCATYLKGYFIYNGSLSVANTGQKCVYAPRLEAFRTTIGGSIQTQIKRGDRCYFYKGMAQRMLGCWVYEGDTTTDATAFMFRPCTFPVYCNKYVPPANPVGGTACQPACSDRQSCVNNICQCKTGLVTSGTTCSCPSVNLYWDTTTLTCQPACQGRCKDREICVNGNTCECVTGFNRSPSGICEPPPTTCQKICRAYGDPHFLSFDGLSFSFHGSCTYILAEYNVPGSTCRFRISLRSVRATPSVAATFSTVLMFESLTPGQTFSTRFNRISKELMINNKLSSSPYVGLPGDYQVGYELGMFFVRSAQCSIDVTFRDYSLIIQLGKATVNTYAGNLIGLCGNCDGNKTNDLDNCSQGTMTIGSIGRTTLRDSCLASDAELSLRPSCVKPTPPVTCEKSILDALGSDKQKCALLKLSPGPFAQCLASGVVDVAPFFESCKADACYTQADINKQQEIICASLSTFEVKCREAGFTTDVWRSATFCPPPVCPQNSHYNHSAVTPRPTCTQPFQYHAANAVKLPLCICDDGYILSGQICILKSKCDVCAKSQCKNGGICEPQNSDYRCICQKDYTGQYCENGPGNLCDPNPCNGGVCQIDPYGEVVCQCPESLTGERCTMPVPVDPCSSNPCKNGLCQILLVNGVPNTYTCSCDPDYTGDQCQCGPNEPYNANTGTCVSNPCSANPCGTNGQCVQSAAGYTCNCNTGFTGDQCQCDPNKPYDANSGTCVSNPCLANPCGTNGQCVQSAAGYTCNCNAGFTGDQCQCGPNTPYDANSGTCVSNPCSANPCGTNGQCVQSGAGYTCNCNAGFTGDQCQCGPNEPYDANTQACKLVCNSCTDRQVLDASGICQCVSGTTWNGSQCACDSNRLWDPVTKQCFADVASAGWCRLFFTNPCSPGLCVSNGRGYYCICPKGHTITGCR
ncbi:uncharacterized protein LOC141903353 [Tubulanus polymorphus]|uniref:uncharacterized protein LOC141903353 n=1 Tax=Tubulanus polymorphus TaxID=672921 RepID=UPI003DA631AB